MLGHEKKLIKKLDKATKEFVLYKFRIMGVFLTTIGLLWAAEMTGYFDYDLFMPAILVLSGIAIYVKSYLFRK